MTSMWLPQAQRHDLSGRRGNGPFNGEPHGIVLHVNASGKGSQGTSPQWYIDGGGENEVCPNWQVHADGTIYQFLPANWQPWTQRDGNSWGPSIETGGDPSEPLSAAQITSCGLIVAFVHEHLGVPLTVTDSLAKRGLGTHAMGGQAWGGHPCPGAIRAAQRSLILDAARGHKPTPPTLLEQIMALDRNSADYKALMNDVQHAAGVGVWQHLVKSFDGKPYTAETFLQAINKHAAAAAGIEAKGK